MKTYKYLWVLFFVGLLCAPGVFATVTWNSPTPSASELLRNNDVVANASTDLAGLGTINLTLTLGTTTVSNSVGGAGIPSVKLTINDLAPGDYVLTATAKNTTGTSDTSTRAFTVSNCNNTDYTIWGALLLVFIVGLIFFAYNGFVNGSGISVLWLVALSIATMIIGTFLSGALRTVC